MILGVFLSLFIFLNVFDEANALDVRHNSETCKKIRERSRNTKPNTTTCYDKFYLDISKEAQELGPQINDISQKIIRVGTLENLSTILKNQFLNNISAKYAQTLILAKGMGYKDQKLKNSIHEATSSCSAQSGKLKSHLEEIHNNIKSPPRAQMRKHRKDFIKKMYSAFVEKHRLQTLLKTVEKYTPEDQEKINNIKSNIATLHQHYPLLNHIRENGMSSDVYAKSFVQRMMLKLRHRTPEDTLSHSYQTHPNINEILKLEDENQIPTEYKKLKRPHHRKNPYLYAFLHENI